MQLNSPWQCIAALHCHGLFNCTHFQWSSLSILSSRFPLWRLLCWIDWHQKLQLCRAAPYIGDKNVKTHRTVIEIPSQNKAVHTSDLKKPSTPLIEIASQSAFVALQGQRRRWECRLSGERDKRGRKDSDSQAGSLSWENFYFWPTRGVQQMDGWASSETGSMEPYSELNHFLSNQHRSEPKKFNRTEKLQYLKIFSNHFHRQSGILWASLILSLFGD